MWIGKAFSMMWLLVYGILPLLIMVALYSSVVYSLWFRRQTANELSAQKKVNYKDDFSSKWLSNLSLNVS